MVEKIRRIVESLYTDSCCVYEKRAVNKDGRTQFEEEEVHKDIPCRVSAKAYLFGERASKENENLLSVNKRVKVFLPAGCLIKPGSVMKITREGRETVYGKSGAMSFYKSHNEVMVELCKDYA